MKKTDEIAELRCFCCNRRYDELCHYSKLNDYEICEPRLSIDKIKEAAKTLDLSCGEIIQLIK